MATTYQRKYYFVKNNEIDTIPVQPGNVIAAIDCDGILYIDTPDSDNPGQNVRRKVFGVHSVTELPESNYGPENLYILNTQTKLVGSNDNLYIIYMWDDNADTWREVANNTQDVNVTTTPVTETAYYLTGATSATSQTGSLVKNADVSVDANGAVFANAFKRGSADHAINADKAIESDHASKATLDDNGKLLTGYLKNATTTDGSVITFTRGDSTTLNVSTKTYPVVNSNENGLVPKLPIDSKYVFYGDGRWKALDTSESAALSATNDSEGQVIVDTYVKNIVFDDTTRKLNFTKGNGNVSTTEIPDTTYEPYSGSDAGLVPQSSTGNGERFLRVDGTWSSVSEFVGATATEEGTSGVVPTPNSGDTNSFLKSDGTWSLPSEYVGATSTDIGVSGTVPAATSSEKDYFLQGNGSWKSIPVYTAPTTSEPAVPGLVPAAEISESDKYLKGDGTWGDVSVQTFTPTTNGTVNAPGSLIETSYLNNNNTWSIPARNTVGATEFSDSVVGIQDILKSNGVDNEFELSTVVKDDVATVTIDGMVIPSEEYTIEQYDDYYSTITFNDTPEVVNTSETFVATIPESTEPSSQQFSLSQVAYEIVSVTVNDTPTTDYTLNEEHTSITVNNIFATNVIVVTYTVSKTIRVNYEESLEGKPMYLVGVPHQEEHIQSYSTADLYIKDYTLYGCIGVNYRNLIFKVVDSSLYSTKKIDGWTFGENNVIVTFEFTSAKLISTGTPLLQNIYNKYSTIYQPGLVGDDLNMFKLYYDSTASKSYIVCMKDIPIGSSVKFTIIGYRTSSIAG